MTTQAQSSERPYDITIFGATGYTGRLVVQEITKRTPSMRVALAGRNREALQKLASEHPNKQFGIIIADVDNTDSLNKMCESSTCILNLVGPFVLFGEPVIKACIAEGTHYVDITGEANWIEDMSKRYNQMAQKNGVVLVMASGFDSVPADLVAWCTQKNISAVDRRNMHAAITTFTKINSNAGISYGTMQTILTSIERGDAGKRIELEPPPENHRRIKPGIQRVSEIGDYVAWPQEFMPDAYVVRKTHSLLPAPEHFASVEFAHAAILPSRMYAIIASTCAWLAPFVCKIPGVLNYLKSMKNPGQGPEVLPKRDKFCSAFCVLKLFNLQNGLASADPQKVICGRLDISVDPYTFTAISSVEVARFLVQEGASAKKIAGLRTPASTCPDFLLLSCADILRFQITN